MPKNSPRRSWAGSHMGNLSIGSDLDNLPKQATLDLGISSGLGAYSVLMSKCS